MQSWASGSRGTLVRVGRVIRVVSNRPWSTGLSVSAVIIPLGLALLASEPGFRWSFLGLSAAFAVVIFGWLVLVLLVPAGAICGDFGGGREVRCFPWYHPLLCLCVGAERYHPWLCVAVLFLGCTSVLKLDILDNLKKIRF